MNVKEIINKILNKDGKETEEEKTDNILEVNVSDNVGVEESLTS